MTTSTRRASSFRHAIAIGIVVIITAGSTSLCSAATSASATETGWQSELVNKPGCWTEGGYDNRFPCEMAGQH